MKDNKLKIIVACHKSDPLVRSDDVYLPVHVGKAMSELDLGFQGDDQGDNISEKNKSYCELTALYWAWKNTHNYRYIGLAHYRRYLNLDFSKTNVNDVLTKYDFIIPRKRVLSTSNLVHIQSLLSSEDVAIMLDGILELYPEMRKSILDYFYNSNRYTLFNMFVTSRVNLEKYCMFLFPLLSNIENRLGSHSYSRLTRSIGYMAEALLGLWIEHNHFKVREEDCVLNGKLMSLDLKSRLKQFKDTLSFRLAKTKITKRPTFYAAVINGLKSDGILIKNLEACD